MQGQKRHFLGCGNLQHLKDKDRMYKDKFSKVNTLRRKGRAGAQNKAGGSLCKV